MLNNARLLMESATAVRGYTANQITRLLQAQMEHEFLPQAVPSYSATEVQNALHTKYPEYAYKEATLNPTNPRDRANGWEVDIVNAFRNDAERKEIIGERDTPTGRSLYISRPLRITNPACLQCHSSVEAAPKTMVDKYGPANGFGWQLNEVIGAQIVSVPMALPVENANRAFYTFMASLTAVFVALFIILNIMMSLLIVRPITRMSKAADEISTGNMEIPEFGEKGGDEVSLLAKSFNRMRRSLEKAIELIDQK